MYMYNTLIYKYSVRTFSNGKLLNDIIMNCFNQFGFLFTRRSRDFPCVNQAINMGTIIRVRAPPRNPGFTHLHIWDMCKYSPNYRLNYRKYRF